MTTRLKHLVLLMLLSLLVAAGVASSPARAELRFGVELGGGSVVDWSASAETGNAFGGLALVGIGDLSLGFGGAAVMPDSRLQAQFGALWLEGRYHLFGHGRLLSPYAVLGFGVALADKFTRSDIGFIPARWSRAANALALLGAGVRFGQARGLSLALDIRAWNHTHLGFQLLAGYTF